MPKTLYVGLYEINAFETIIMEFVMAWVRTEKTPVPQKQIVSAMKLQNSIKDYTTVNALNMLLKKGYIRRAYTTSNKTSYVQLRGL